MLTHLVDRELLGQINEELIDCSAQEILAWSIRSFMPDLTLACSFGGVSGMVLLDMTVKIDPAVPVFFLDTGFLFPETYNLKEEAARRYNISPLAFQPRLTPQQQAKQFGEALWQREPDHCCEIRKVVPNREALAGKRAWIAGLRRDQGETRRKVKPLAWDEKFGLYKVSPLWNWTEEEVWDYIEANDVPYNPLHKQGYPSLGCTNCTRPVAAGEHLRAGRWSGFEKTECGLHR